MRYRGHVTGQSQARRSNQSQDFSEQDVPDSESEGDMDTSQNSLQETVSPDEDGGSEAVMEPAQTKSQLSNDETIPTMMGEDGEKTSNSAKRKNRLRFSI